MIENKKRREGYIIRRGKWIPLKSKSLEKPEKTTNEPEVEVEQYYKSIDDDYVICTICDKRIRKVVNLLWYHLNIGHKISVSENDVNIILKRAASKSSGL